MTVSEKPKSYQAIMVSSTFTDLKGHRQQVIRAIEGLDYRANVMEYDGARADADVIDSSLQFVRDSSAYVGIISRKYGQTPYCPQRNPDRLSIAELEFNEAMRLRRPILLFVMSEKHPVTEADIELDPEKRQKLDTFRQRARRMREGSEVDRVYQVFDSLEQFSTAAATAIGRLAEYLRGDRARDERSEPRKNEQILVPEQDPVQKNEPRTLIVDALHRGHCATLNAALKVAEPDDRILVRPGLYGESIIIDKPVEIVGDGEAGDIIIEGTKTTTVVFEATRGRIENLTLRQIGIGNYCIDISQGQLDLEGCDVTSHGRACVAIHNGADPRLRRNRIHDGREGGAFVYANGKGTLEDNDIFSNTLSGVAISEGGNPILRLNRIYGGSQSGVHVSGKNSRGTLEENEIFANVLAGIAIIDGGNPTLRGNRIHDGKEIGVYVADNGRGTLEENEIFRNAQAGVVIKRGGNPILRRNRIYDGNESGIYVYESGKGTLEENDIFANSGAGVEIREGGNPTLRHNRIHVGRGAGVLVRTNGKGNLEDNDIYANEQAGVEIRHRGDPVLRRNRIHDGSGAGVFVYEDGKGVLEENNIFANAGAGVEIREGGNPTLRRNHIHTGGGAGVLVRTNGRGDLQENFVIANASSGLEVRHGGKPLVCRNRISLNARQAIRVYEGGGGVFEDNDLVWNTLGAWEIAKDCESKVTRKGNNE